MAGTMTLSGLFERAIAAENAARDFYLGLARKFSSQPVIVAFWKSMAEDEEEHARILERSRKSIGQSRLDAAIDISMVKRADTLSNLSVLRMLKSVHNLDDAYLLAHELEASDVNTIFNFLKLKLVPDGEKTNLSAGTIDNHLRKLVDFQKTFGEAELRRRIIAEP
jgi:hypothetical protein